LMAAMWMNGPAVVDYLKCAGVGWHWNSWWPRSPHRDHIGGCLTCWTLSVWLRSWTAAKMLLLQNIQHLRCDCKTRKVYLGGR
jgi:hypothetical protein